MYPRAKNRWATGSASRWETISYPPPGHTTTVGNRSRRTAISVMGVCSHPSTWASVSGQGRKRTNSILFQLLLLFSPF